LLGYVDLSLTSEEVDENRLFNLLGSSRISQFNPQELNNRKDDFLMRDWCLGESNRFFKPIFKNSTACKAVTLSRVTLS